MLGCQFPTSSHGLSLSCSDANASPPTPHGVLFSMCLALTALGCWGCYPILCRCTLAPLDSNTCWFAPCGDIFSLSLGSNSLFLATSRPHPGLTLIRHHLAQLCLMAFGLYCSLRHGGIWN